MKKEALRRFVVNWLNKGATSVPPENPPHGVLRIDRSQLPPDLAKMLDGMIEQVIGNVRPGDVTETMAVQGPPDVPWENWRGAAKAMAFPGWSFCAFGLRYGIMEPVPTVVMVQGIVKGPFGIWRKHFDVCREYDNHGSGNTELLASICHLPSGLGMGLFSDQAIAVEAAELALHVHPDWDFDMAVPGPEAVFSGLLAQSLDLWHGMGIDIMDTMHAHTEEAGHVPLYIHHRDLEAMQVKKPEKLS